MKRFICSQNRLYKNIINVCEWQPGSFTYTNADDEKITSSEADLPEGIILAHPRGIDVASCLDKWLQENPQHRRKNFEIDFSLKEGEVQISKHLSIYLKPEASRVLWNHTKHH